MNGEIVKHDYNGFSIFQREEDGYVNLTDMVKVNPKKKMGHFFENKSTKSFIATLSGCTGIPIDQIVVINESQGRNDERGTWGHPKLAIKLACWISSEFEVWAMTTLYHEILKQSGAEQTIDVKAVEVSQLPPADVRLRECANTFRELQTLVGIDFTNPRIQQFYQDVVNNIVIDSQRHLPPSSEKKAEWMGIVEFANELGYRVTPKQAPTLGKRAKAWFVSETGASPREEKRLVNGRMCPVKLYDVAEHRDGLTQVVRDYFGGAISA